MSSSYFTTIKSLRQIHPGVTRLTTTRRNKFGRWFPAFFLIPDFCTRSGKLYRDIRANSTDSAALLSAVCHYLWAVQHNSNKFGCFPKRSKPVSVPRDQQAQPSPQNGPKACERIIESTIDKKKPKVCHSWEAESRSKKILFILQSSMLPGI